MDKARFLIETHLRTGESVGELAAAHGVRRGLLYKLLVRYHREGAAGLEPRSRRPHRSPARVADLFEDEVVALRKELADGGFDAGAETIHVHLAARHPECPSVPTIWRILRRRGFVVAQPHKRPKSSWTRFCADFPNECWQADVTHVEVANGVVFEVLNMLDDHSRVCVSSRAFVTVSATDVVRNLHMAASTWGYPASVLTDNGLVFSTQRRHQMAGALEVECLALGITTKHSRPYHPRPAARWSAFTRP